MPVTGASIGNHIAENRESVQRDRPLPSSAGASSIIKIESEPLLGAYSHAIMGSDSKEKGRVSEPTLDRRLESSISYPEFPRHGAPRQLERLPAPFPRHLSRRALPGHFRFRKDQLQPDQPKHRPPVCTENLIRVDDVMESPKLAE